LKKILQPDLPESPKGHPTVLAERKLWPVQDCFAQNRDARGVLRLWQAVETASRVQNVSLASRTKFTAAKIATKKRAAIIVGNERSVANACKSKHALHAKSDTKGV